MRKILVATKKRGEVLENCWSKKKSIAVPQYDSFMGIGGGIGELLEML
jgi:hypothetical protein